MWTWVITPEDTTVLHYPYPPTQRPQAPPSTMATKYRTMNWKATYTAEAFKIFKQQNSTDSQMPSASASSSHRITPGRRSTGVPRQQDARPPKPHQSWHFFPYQNSRPTAATSNTEQLIEMYFEAKHKASHSKCFLKVDSFPIKSIFASSSCPI